MGGAQHCRQRPPPPHLGNRKIMPHHRPLLQSAPQPSKTSAHCPPVQTIFYPAAPAAKSRGRRLARVTDVPPTYSAMLSERRSRKAGVGKQCLRPLPKHPANPDPRLVPLAHKAGRSLNIYSPPGKPHTHRRSVCDNPVFICWFSVFSMWKIYAECRALQPI